MGIPRVLIVDDDVVCARTLQNRLSARGFEVHVRRNGPEALQLLTETPFQAAILEAILPGMPVAKLLEQALKARPSLRPVIIAARGNLDMAVEVMKKGALDYLPKPLNYDAVCDRMQDLVRGGEDGRDAAAAEPEPGPEDERDFYQLIGRCDGMRQIYAIIEKVAGTQASVLITGESGTGKELVARTIHRINPRRTGRFVTINCGAIPETLLETEMFGHMKGSFTGAVRDAMGLFETADGGTVFLDEIGNISLNLQVKLLRVLQDGEFKPVGSTRIRRVDLRILAATNTDLKEAVQEGRFRDDLYYRLNVVSLHLPPLRERSGDLELLVDHWADRVCRDLNRARPEIGADFLEALGRYAWPGNIRELRNVIERAIILADGDRLGLDQVPTEIVRFGREPRDVFRLPYTEAKKVSEEIFSKEYLERLCRKARGNVSKAAAMCGVNRQSLHRMLKRHQINYKAHKPRGDKQ